MKNNYDLQVDIARDIFLQYNQEALIRKFDLQADGVMSAKRSAHTIATHHISAIRNSLRSSIR